MRRISRTREELIADFVALDQRYSDLVKSCTREQLAWRADGRWSIAECIEHVALANSQYLVRAHAALEEKKGTVSAPITSLWTAGWFSTYFVESVVGPGMKGRYKAPKAILPLAIDAELALEKLLESHRQIRELLEPPLQLDLNRIRFKNPFVLIVRFTVATGVLILAAHGRRHLLQAERVRETEGFPTDEASGGVVKDQPFFNQAVCPLNRAQWILFIANRLVTNEFRQASR